MLTAGGSRICMLKGENTHSSLRLITDVPLCLLRLMDLEPISPLTSYISLMQKVTQRFVLHPTGTHTAPGVAQLPRRSCCRPAASHIQPRVSSLGASLDTSISNSSSAVQNGGGRDVASSSSIGTSEGSSTQVCTRSTKNV